MVTGQSEIGLLMMGTAVVRVQIVRDRRGAGGRNSFFDRVVIGLTVVLVGQVRGWRANGRLMMVATRVVLIVIVQNVTLFYFRKITVHARRFDRINVRDTCVWRDSFAAR